MVFGGQGKLRKLECSRSVRFKLDQLLENLEFSEKQAFKSMREIRRFCKEDPELSQCIKYLMTIPGIGWIVASQLLARIGNWPGFWGWFRPRILPERELNADRSPTAETDA